MKVVGEVCLQFKELTAFHTSTVNLCLQCHIEVPFYISAFSFNIRKCGAAMVTPLPTALDQV